MAQGTGDAEGQAVAPLRTTGREPAPRREVVPTRLTAEPHEGLLRVGQGVKPGRGNAQTGIAEALRRALDFYLALPAARRRASLPGEEPARKMTSLRLLPEEAAVLDQIVAVEGMRGRGELVRRAVSAYLAAQG